MIDTRHGTANSNSLSKGNCLPLTSTPHPMNYFAPQTDGSRGAWWFHPEDRTFEGIRLTHQASPWVGDFSSFVMQPITGEVNHQSVWHTRSSYKVENSIFKPWEFSTYLERYQLNMKLTPSRYGAKIIIDFIQEDGGLAFYLGEKHDLTLIDDHHLVGWVSNFADCQDSDFKMYVSIYSDEPIQTFSGNLCRFGKERQITLTLATSYLSIEQAIFNREHIQNESYEDLRRKGREEWQAIFNKVQIKHHESQAVSTFYHNLYRAFLFPTCFYERDAQGEAYHYQTMTQTVETGVYYTNNGFWDTGKTVYPLYSLIAQDKLEEMLEAYLNVYREVGYLPKWLAPDERGMMPGMAIDSVIADALTKGIRMDLAEEFLEAMIHSAEIDSGDDRYGRANAQEYIELGYVPSSRHESVNQTLDNAFSDYCIAQVADLLGENEVASIYRKRSLGYRQLFDKETGLMRGKDENRHFINHFSTTEWGGPYTEGSAWQNSFNAFHDIEGYIELVGGKQAFKKLLTTCANKLPQFEIGSYGFEIHEMTEMAVLNFGQIALSNQPSFHVPYLFNYCQGEDSTQVLTRQLLKEAFSDGWQGFPGDEDNGSMASWFIFSSLGFYPVCPGSQTYQLGSGLFDQVAVHLSNGQILNITNTPNESQHQFVVARNINGVSYKNNNLSHQAILAGMTMENQLGIVPSHD